MKTILTLGSLALLAASLTACVAVAPAPGAERVRETSVPADVQSCKAVGNINPNSYHGDDVLLRNQVVGLGGDTALMTVTLFGQVLGGPGIAYRCAKD